MKGIKELVRNKLGYTATVVSGDKIQLLYQDAVILEREIDRFMEFDEAVIFEADESVFGRPALGGAFIEK